VFSIHNPNEIFGVWQTTPLTGILSRDLLKRHPLQRATPHGIITKHSIMKEHTNIILALAENTLTLNLVVASVKSARVKSTSWLRFSELELFNLLGDASCWHRIFNITGVFLNLRETKGFRWKVSLFFTKHYGWGSQD
jgi:hypothetical protein